MGGGGGDSGPTPVFGSLYLLKNSDATIVFIITLVVIICLEAIFKFMDKWSEKIDQVELYRKAQYELMLLGIISFALFLIQQGFADISHDILLAFEIIHIIILFIALAFIAQACILVYFSKSDGKNLLRSIRTPETQLLKDFDSYGLNTKRTKKKSNATALLANQRIPTKFWEKIEMKILEKLFFHSHGNAIPHHGFNYGAYIGYLYNKYLAEVGEVSITAWFFLAILILFNYFKYLAITEEIECSPKHHCDDKYFSYPFFLGVIMNVFLFGVYVASNYYYAEFLTEGMNKVFKINVSPKATWCFGLFFSSRAPITTTSSTTPATTSADSGDKNKLKPRYLNYIDCLNLLQDDVAHNRHSINTGRLNTNRSSPSHQQPSTADGHGHHTTTTTTSGHVVGGGGGGHHVASTIPSSRLNTSRNETAKGGGAHEVDIEHEDIMAHIEHLQNEEAERKHLKELKKLEKKKSLYHTIFKSGKDVVYRAHHSEGSTHLATKYLFGNPHIYFFMVEFMFLVQSFYLSIYLTQLLPKAVKLHRADWGIVLFLLSIIAFCMLKPILYKSVILHAATHLEEEITIRVCEESNDVIKMTKKVHHIVNKLLESKTCDCIEKKIEYLKTLFNNMDEDGSDEIDKKEFRQFLGEVNVYLSSEKFSLLWKVIDDDLSGYISRDEMLCFFFPEEKKALQRELAVIYKLTQSFHELLQKTGKPVIEWRNELNTMINLFDDDGTNDGLLNKEQIKVLISTNTNLKLDDKSMIHLMSSLHQNDDGLVRAEEIVDLLLSFDSDPAVNKVAANNDVTRLSSVSLRPLNTKDEWKAVDKNKSSSYDSHDSHEDNHHHHTTTTTNGTTTAVAVSLKQPDSVEGNNNNNNNNSSTTSIDDALAMSPTDVHIDLEAGATTNNHTTTTTTTSPSSPPVEENNNSSSSSHKSKDSHDFSVHEHEEDKEGEEHKVLLVGSDKFDTSQV